MHSTAFEEIVRDNYSQAELDRTVVKVMERVTAEQADVLTGELTRNGTWGGMA